MPNYTTTGHQPIITRVKYHSYIIFTQRIVNTACCSVSNILLSILHLCPFTLPEIPIQLSLLTLLMLSG